MPGEQKNLSEIRAAAIVALLKQRWNFVETLFAQAGAARFAFTPQRFAVELARSAASRFKLQTPSATELEEYLSALHLADFALACACVEGAEPAWEFFVANYRGYLRSCAAAILRRGGDAPEARELADSLFAELYGLADGRRGAGSLFRYFHGRSSLKTWLRAVLAQRHIDAIRASRKCESLDAADDAGQLPDGRSRAGIEHRRKDSLGPLAAPADPYREKYVARFCSALCEALQKLTLADSQRIRRYYAEEKTLAEVGVLGAEHESSVSRNLERIRRELRERVEETLRQDVPRADAMGRDAEVQRTAERGLSEAQIALCFEYATEDAPIDFNLLFPSRSEGSTQREAGRKDS
jgi:RNA polymerase sigma-70 factor (ECF subfamily)